jgi:hypothetical protein
MARANRKKSPGKRRKSQATVRGKSKTSSTRKAAPRRAALKRISKLKGLTAGWV